MYLAVIVFLSALYTGWNNFKVIRNQLYLINTLREEIIEAKVSIDQYAFNIEEYYELKAIGDKWFHSLSEQQKDRMQKLREVLRIDEIPNTDVAKEIVRDFCTQQVEILSYQLTELKDVLYNVNIEQMRKLQENINIRHHFICLKARKLTELQTQRGTLYQMFLYFISFVRKIVFQILS